MRRLAIALSLANLCYLRIWSEVLTYQLPDTYLMKTPPKPVEYIAVVANVLLAGGVFWALATLARRKFSVRAFRFAEMGFILSLVMPLLALRAVLSNRFPYLKSPLFELLGTSGVAALGAALAIVGLLTVVFLHRPVARIAAAVLAILSPFCAITFAQAIWKAVHYDDRAFAPKPAAPLIAGARAFPRVLWFVCDEWDYRLTFIDRDVTLQLPEIDRLRQTSIFSEEARPPGPETPRSIPAYFIGRPVERVEYAGPADLRLHFRGISGSVSWTDQPNVFQHARAIGLNTALVGWFHPGCRVLNGLTRCDWWEMAMQHNSMGDGFLRIMPNQTRSLFETNLFSLFGRSLPAEQQTGVYHAILREARRVATDPAFGFAVVHLPVPHAPHAYDRRTGRFTLGNSPIRGYIDSLALLDRTVGEIRRAMEDAGTWDNTNVLFTSDHPYREAMLLDGKSDPRIPYVLKLAGQKEGAVYTAPFDAVLTADLLLAVLRGDVRTTAAAAAWLDQNRSRFPVEK